MLARQLITQFTPASQRAILAAGRWKSFRSGQTYLLPQQLLLGLLAEEESRAGLMLAARGIDVARVCQQWPQWKLDESATPTEDLEFSAELISALKAAEARLSEYPRPLILATEHLLLGLVAVGDDVSRWLVEQGFDADRLENELHRLAGHQPGPLAVDDPPMVVVPVTPPATRQVPANDLVATVEVNNTSQPVAQSVGVLRVIDAAANRAREGLRVVEDFVRFVLDDAHLTEQLKSMRHDLTAALSRFSQSDRLASRETQADVGTQLTTAAEQTRADATSVVTANFKRLQESLRSLEEFGKLHAADIGAEFERLRYQSYTLERAVEITRTSIERLTAVNLYVLVDGRASIAEFRSLVESLVVNNAGVLQLRDKNLPDRELLGRARVLREVTRGTRTLFIMNDRPDLAALSQADGVHVGQDELTIKDARAIVGPAALIGVSTHSLAQARQAVLDGANYIGVGPTFSSGTKQFAASALQGVELLKQVAREIRLPAFAIGGIQRANLDQVLAAGFTRVAVSGAVLAASDPAAAVRELSAVLHR
jgi:thiamine-phosphate pyrophosphorylase